jgi:hypothetical protein
MTSRACRPSRATRPRRRSSRPIRPATSTSIAGQRNRTIKEATVKRFHYDDHNQRRRHLADFIDAYNFGRHLKTLRGLTPYKFICRIWTSQPEQFILNPIHQMPGLNTVARRFAANAHHIGCKQRLEPAGMLRFAFDLMNQIKSKTL